MVGNALACGKCGAGLPPPDVSGRSTCVYCGAEHRGGRSSEVLSAALGERPSWHDCEDAARIPLTEDAVLDLVRQHFAGTDSVYVCPHVPPKRELAVRRVHVIDLPARERILALYDAAPLDNGHEGFVVTANRLCWKNAHEPAASIAWEELDPDKLYLDRHRLYVGDEAVVIAEDEILDASANAFHVLALSGASTTITSRYDRPSPLLSGAFAYVGPRPHSTSKEATPPPPHTTSYFAYASHAQEQEPDYSCWHCQTPLYETTPQCAYCGAIPTAAGWRHTG